MTAPPPIDDDLPGLLRRALTAFEAGDETALDAALDAIGPARASAAPALLGGLALGGAGFALRLAASRGDRPEPGECLEAVVGAFTSLVEAPPGAPEGHERRVAEWLVAGFSLPDDPASVLDVMRAALLVEHGPLSELPEAVLAAMRHERWELALRGLTRTREGLGAGTPRNAYGLGAMVLHRLGRYAEADRWVRDGLGGQQQLLDIGPAQPEAALLARWGRHARPLVTILCTTYNHERYIESAIRGFLAQDCEFPFEILIHDDASTDGTQDVIRRWQQRYPQLIRPVLQTVNQKSRGVHPFELLLARARGDYVATCEGDDFWIHPHKLQHQVSFLMAHPDASCSAHNYYHFIESRLLLRPWTKIGRDFFVSQRQLMATQFLLWLPTLVFRKTFSSLPPERALAAFGDQFLTSWLGTMGRCAYFDSLTAAVRRENEFSTWSPLPDAEKERRRVRTWAAMLRLHERLGNAQAVADLQAKIAASKLDAATQASILAASAPTTTPTLAAA